MQCYKDILASTLKFSINLEHYGIDSKILLWITNFLNNRKQRVVVDCRW